MSRFIALCLAQRQLPVQVLSLQRHLATKLSISYRLLHNNASSIKFPKTKAICILQRNKELMQPWQHTLHTSPRHQINPLLWMLIKPAGKALSIISGRSLRKWWQALPQSQKHHIRQQIYQQRYKLTLVVAVIFAAGFATFLLHLQETPITKRKRFIAFTDEQFMKIAEHELEMQWEALKELVINPYDPKLKPIYDKVVTVAQRIVDSNQHLEKLRQQKWNVILIDSDEANAFVLPTGQIFVFRGMLQLTENLDQLAVILGHEIAHVVLNHGAEKVSFGSIIDLALIVVMAALWFLMPTDGIAVVTQWFYNKIVTLLLELPYSRKLETEADQVGLELIARACFDVRESSTFWQKMAFNQEQISKGEMAPPEWISTHPASEKRAAILDECIPDALKLRETCHCPRLPRFDPRTNFDAAKRIIQQETSPRSSGTQQGVILKPKVVGMKAVAVAAVAIPDTLTKAHPDGQEENNTKPGFHDNRPTGDSNKPSDLNDQSASAGDVVDPPPITDSPGSKTSSDHLTQKDVIVLT